MTLLATRSTKLSKVVAFESMPEYGYSRQTATVTIQAGMDVGAALVLVSGKYEWIVAADTANLTAGCAVLVDHYKDIPNLAVGDHSLAILVRDAGITSASLTYADTLTAPQKALVVAQLKLQGIVDRVQV